MAGTTDDSGDGKALRGVVWLTFDDKGDWQASWDMWELLYLGDDSARKVLLAQLAGEPLLPPNTQQLSNEGRQGNTPKSSFVVAVRVSSRW